MTDQARFPFEGTLQGQERRREPVNGRRRHLKAEASLGHR